jgi:hypothetical protein
LGRWLQSIPQAAAAFVVLIGATGVAGWWLDIEVLKSVLPHFVPMKFNTAWGLVLSGLALYLQRFEQVGGAARRTAQACASAVGVLGSLTLLQYMSGRDFGIDELFFTKPPGASGVLYPISLPISRILRSDALSLHRQDEIAAALQADPQGLRAGKAIVLAVEKAAEAGYHPNHLLP